MKVINKIGIWMLSVFMLTTLLQSCAKADDEFVHRTNTISQMICKASHSSGEFRGTIYEYNKNDEIMSGQFTQEDIEGGYGLILFAIPKSLENDVNLTSVYLVATVTYDEFITPSLTGKHDISGDGIIISVKSGVGTTRRYRVRGYYE
ncbi:hypothetical protein [Bacteroides sp.]|uniref:hypothetical protein n=1 Tax=Bacteroides sp. TaxID=29523 RepID=UPI002633736C|nr:hypothetical protein [Bacteroides sp.]MDD3038002.1 hypothetical protein [Bacteroides sp.]